MEEKNTGNVTETVKNDSKKKIVLYAAAAVIIVLIVIAAFALKNGGPDKPETGGNNQTEQTETTSPPPAGEGETGKKIEIYMPEAPKSDSYDDLLAFYASKIRSHLTVFFESLSSQDADLKKRLKDSFVEMTDDVKKIEALKPETADKERDAAVKALVTESKKYLECLDAYNKGDEEKAMEALGVLSSLLEKCNVFDK